MKNKYFLSLVLFTVLLLGGAFVFQRASGTTAWLWEVSRQGQFFLPLLTVSALIDSINPCAFSILIVSIIFLFSLGRKREEVLSLGLIYIFGIFAAYLLIGFGLLHALNLFGVPHFMSKLGAAFLVLFGALNVLEGLFPNFPIQLGVPKAAHAKMSSLLESVSIPAMFGLGMLVGLCEFPCTGGPYLMVIGMLHDTKTYLQGAGYLFLYNLIFVLPLVLILFISGNAAVTEKVKAYQKANTKRMKLFGGFLMILLAYLFLIL